MQEQEEFQERWQRLQKRAAEEQVEAVMVWSRGGGPLDGAADVVYLANHYSAFPLIVDLPPHWAGRGHSAVLVPVQGEPTLIVDTPDWRRDLVQVEEVRFSLDLPSAAAALLREKNLAGKRVGLVGRFAMLAAAKDALLDASPSTEFVAMDDLVERIRAVKSPWELDMIREAASVGDRVVGAIMEAALRPGTTEAEAVAAGYSVAARECVSLYDAAVASGPNSDYYAYGRLPSWTDRELLTGDLFHIDTYGALNGYLYDFARCCVTGGRPTDTQRQVMEGLIAAIQVGVDTVRPGVSSGAVYGAVQNELVRQGLAPEQDDQSDDPHPSEEAAGLATSFPAHGHSFGLGWEAPWIIPNGEDILEEGMCIAVEGMAGLPGVGSAAFEQDLIVTTHGSELITQLQTHFW